MNRTPRRVVVTAPFFDEAAIGYLRHHGCEVEIAKGPPDSSLTGEQLINLLQGAAGWIVGQAYATRDLLTALPDLQVLARRGVGYERIDVDAVRDLGRVLTIGAGGNDASVADHTIGLMLAVARRLRESQNRMLAGNWSILMSSDLFGKTVGIVGLGRIGKSLVQRLKGFEVRILVCHPRPDDDYGKANDIAYVEMETLLRQSDYVTVHAPLTPQTRFLIGRDALALMKPTGILVNTARGGLVDDEALLHALKAGRLAGAGLDVYLSESDPAYKPVSEELIALPNVIATPHSAASSVEGLARTNMVVAESVVAVLDGQSPPEACIITDGRRITAGR
ncbi:phosphoglycerate dehydrogenase [Phyllobacterium zundukense]|uniref:Hydroxyacid dehydrogenase n=1 Tax=Phyllobacterium zundukense TaxID=1867719 RepID=A0A2N9VRH9_9HYPH|nr:phosphoglycerate dehydrogenase [Phyllobacterium zundukense]ATU92521.1 hydroxyacid dehydrogenase [Phyllobacterium zundukense]PIO42097.1 hydroxyacid dehydrogenase [Phyllobacterium zundukense]